MARLNISATKDLTYDAIVIGSGISGGWAAKELTEKGLRVLMLERGRPLEHIAGYENALKAPWEGQYAAGSPWNKSSPTPSSPATILTTR